jgi:hypothetical protein
MDADKPFNKKIKPFNFMLIGSERNDVIPCLPFNKEVSEIQYKPFVDYKTDTASDKLLLPSQAYWYTLDDILTKYVRHNDNKFDYDIEGIAHRKHIVVNRIRYIGKESNNLEDNLTGIEDPDYLEYTRDYEIVKSNEFTEWILSLKPKDVRDKGISERGLRNFKQKVENGKGLKNRSKIARILFEYYKSKSTAQ